MIYNEKIPPVGVRIIVGSDFDRKIIISAYDAFQIVIDFRPTKIRGIRQIH